MFRNFITAAAILALSGSLASADEVTDALESALEAYQDGDIQYALEELEFAKQRMTALKTDALVNFLPEAPEGWTREVNTEMNAGLAMMGGGVGAEAEYSGDDHRMTIRIMADNPMVGAMAAMLGNATAMGATIERVGRQKFMVQDGQMQGLVDRRILVQAEGAPVEVMVPVLETIDYRKLGDFGR